MTSTNRKGRPRKAGVARSNGRIIAAERQREEPANAVVLAFRQRRFGDKAGEDPRWGYELGRLFLGRQITLRQHDAGLRWAEACARYAVTMGYPAPTPKAVRIGGGGGAPLQAEPDPRQVQAIASQFMGAQTALAAAGRYCLQSCREVCILDVETGQWPLHMFAALKGGLDALADYFGVPVGIETIKERREAGKEAAQK